MYIHHQDRNLGQHLLLDLEQRRVLEEAQDQSLDLCHLLRMKRKPEDHVQSQYQGQDLYQDQILDLGLGLDLVLVLDHTRDQDLHQDHDQPLQSRNKIMDMLNLRIQ